MVKSWYRPRLRYITCICTMKFIKYALHQDTEQSDQLPTLTDFLTMHSIIYYYMICKHSLFGMS